MLGSTHTGSPPYCLSVKHWNVQHEYFWQPFQNNSMVRTAPTWITALRRGVFSCRTAHAFQCGESHPFWSAATTRSLKKEGVFLFRIDGLGLSCRTRCSGEALLNPRVRSVLTFRRVFHRRSDGFQWEKGLRVWSVVPFRDQCRGWINGPFTETAQEFFWCLLFFFLVLISLFFF